MLLGERDDRGVGGRVKEEGDKLLRLPEECVVDSGDNEGVGGEKVQGVVQGAG